jgi:hypothetical protein
MNWGFLMGGTMLNDRGLTRLGFKSKANRENPLKRVTRNR